MPENLEHNGFRISHTAGARQVVLLCHGGWTPIEYRKAGFFSRKKARGDGYTMIPKGTVVYFYSVHTVTNAGSKCTQDVLECGAGASGGVYQVYNAPPLPSGMNEEQTRAVQGVLKRNADSFALNATRYTERFGDESGERLVQIYNYLLCYERRINEEDIWTQHQAGNVRNKPHDGAVDLMMLTKKYDMNGKTMTHFADALAAARMMNGGHDYDVFHYAPCRDVVAGKWFSGLGQGYGDAPLG